MISTIQRNEFFGELLPFINNEISIFVYKNRLNYVMSREDIEDMQSYVYLEALKALKRYNAEYQVTPKTFINQRVLGAMKDFISQNKEVSDREEVLIVEKVASDLDAALELPLSDIEKILQANDLSSEETKEIILELLEADEFSNIDLLEVLISLPENRLKLIYSFFVLEKSMKEIADNLNLSYESGWVYRLKNKCLKELRMKLNKKGVI